MRLIEDDDAVEVAPQPVDDLSDPGALALALGRAQRGIGGEEDGIAQLNGGTLPVMRERDDVALGATEGGPEIRRAWFRDRVCQPGDVLVDAVFLKKKYTTQCK